MSLQRNGGLQMVHACLRKPGPGDMSARSQERAPSGACTADERLKNIDLSLAPGQLTLIVGETGAGKSTLLEATAGLWPLDDGQIFVDGYSLYAGKRVNPRALSLVGLSTQQAERQLFAQTVHAELLYSLQSQSTERSCRDALCEAALSAVNLSTNLLQVSPLHLSGGQKRRVALASVLITKPHWLLLDEPTAALDGLVASQIVQSVARLTRTQSIGAVVATHDLDAWLPAADRVIVIHEGQVQADYSVHAGTLPPDGALSVSQYATAAKVRGVLAHYGISVSPKDTSSTAMAEALSDYLENPAQATENAIQASYGATSQNAWLSHSLTNAPLAAVTNLQQVLRTACAEPTPESMDNPHTYDPRALWLAYFLLSATTLLQQSWMGLGAAFLCVLWWLWRLRISWLRAATRVKGFAIFLLVAALLAGVRLHLSAPPIDWLLHPAAWMDMNWSASRLSALNLTRILLLLVAGFSLSAAVPFLRMKAALRQTSEWLGKTGFPAESVALAGALTVKFIPLIGQEAMRMRHIIFLRSKRQTRPNSLRLRDIKAFAIPLLLAVLQASEDFATALEARGYRHDRGPVPDKLLSSEAQLRFSHMDWRLLGESIVIFLLLLTLQKVQ